ncbi:MAG: AsmA-like C-terminal region-containing protein [Alsobacter sp.]
MKKLAALCAAGLGAIGLGAGFSPWPLAGDTVRRLLADPLGRAGYEIVDIQGGEITLLPLPRVEMSQFSVRDKQGETAVRASSVRGSLRLLGLPMGQVELADLTLNKAFVVLPPGQIRDGLRRLAGLAEPGEDAPETPGRPVAPVLALQKVVLIDGTLAVAAAADSPPEPVLTAVNAVLAETREGTLDVSGSAQWQGQTFQVSGTGLPLRAAPSAGASPASHPLDLTLNSALGDFRLSGEATNGSSIQTSGELVVKSPAVDRLAEWIALDLPLPLNGAFELSGTLKAQSGRIGLSSVRVVLPAGRFDGVLGLREAGDRLSLDGTLDTDSMDLTEALLPLLPASGPDGWSRDPFDGRLLPRGDVDLRISAAKLNVGRLNLANAAMTLLGRNGRTDAVLGNAELFKGTAKGRLSVSSGPRGFDLKLTGSVDKIDSAAALTALVDQRRLAGIASGSLQVEGSGDSPASLMRSLEGKLGGTIRQGELIGINVPDVLKRLERRPLVTALDVKGGRTPIDSGAISARISKGVAEVLDGLIVAQAARILLTGQVNIAERAFSLAGIALPGEPPAGAEPLGLPFEVVGSFEEPQVLPDAKALIRRSGAAAPFFQPRPAAAPAGGPEALVPLGQPQP